MALGVLELLFLAQRKQGQSRVLILERADAQVQLEKMLVRVLYATRAIDQKKYLRLQVQLQQIGRELGGWIKNIRAKRNSAG